MAPSTIPPQLKILTAFIRRAEELDHDQQNPDSGLIAYYCRAYAVDKGIKLRIDDGDVNTFLFGLMDTLELTKKSLVISDETGGITCENYAYNIFSKADDEYRAGNSTKETARNFYAASTFFDILEQFGPLDDEVLEKRKYSKWKAADILKAIQSGQRPTLPDTPAFPPATGQSLDPFHSIPSAPTSVPILPVTLPLTPFANPNTHTQAPPAYQPPQASQQQTLPQLQPRYQQPLPLTPPTPVPLTGYNGQAGDTNGRIKDAIEFSAFAISALKHNDVVLARQRLTAALAALEF